MIAPRTASTIELPWNGFGESVPNVCDSAFCKMINECKFRNRAAWRLSNDELSVAIVQGGGHLAELKLLNGDFPNLLWEPPWETMDPQAFIPEVHEFIYGGGSEARLLSGILGHNLCFPFWGEPTASEYAAGATAHGESNVVRWQRDPASDRALAISAKMPESHTCMRRVIRIESTQIHFDCIAENLSMWDRPVAWCEHVTFGPPFLSAATEFEASVGAGFVTAHEQGGTFHWPEGRGEIRCDLRRFSSRTHRHLVNSFLVDDNSGNPFFRAVNRDIGIAVEYRYPAAQFQWLNVWENNDEHMQTRGMEFSNTPRHGTMKTLVQTDTVLDAPTYEWIDARGKLKKQFTISVKRV